EAPFLHRHVAGHLDHPRLIGMRRHASHMDFPARQMNKEEDVISHQASRRPHLGSEEVGGHEDVHVRADELLPYRGRLAFWRWRDTMALENIPHRLVTDRIAQVGEDADDPVVAPGTIFLGHADNQGLQLLVNWRTPWGLALWGAVKFLGHKRAVPAENRVRLNNLRHFLYGLLAQLLADLSQ